MRGEPQKQIIVGYTAYGEIMGRRWKLHYATTDPEKAKKLAVNDGMKNPRLYPMYKE